MNYNSDTVKSPIGRLTLVSDTESLVALLWEDDRPNRIRLPNLILSNNDPLLKEAKKQLSEFFQRKRRNFDLPLKLQGTDFQIKVWKALQKIPYGYTISYLQLAEMIGNPKASRAVGAANGKNPISIIIPCHRVIGSSGDLTGFAGGLKTKKTLLELESET